MQIFREKIACVVDAPEMKGTNIACREMTIPTSAAQVEKHAFPGDGVVRAGRVNLGTGLRSASIE